MPDSTLIANDSLMAYALRTFRKACACGEQAVALCDWPMPNKKSGHCDTPMCDAHLKITRQGLCFCPEHQALPNPFEVAA
ncbi:MAG TPA: hypothetical protein VGM18_05025 [Candidatus Sulfotelmatobacter sp.]|jgi:hypothetical protein